MWKPMIRCSLIGGLIVFLWMMISWMILPMHQTMMNKFTDSSEVTSCITRYAPRDGIYVIPTWDEVEQQTAAQSPFIFVNIRRGIDYTTMVPSIICSIITQIIGAALITYLLLHTKAMKYWSRVWFVTIIGLIIAILGMMPAWIWWHFPIAWTILEMFDLVVAWFLGGLVIAKLVKN